MPKRMTPVILSLAAALAAAPARAGGWNSSGMSPADLAIHLKKSEELLKSRESILKRAGIVDPKDGVDGQIREVVRIAVELEEKDKRDPRANLPSASELAVDAKAPGFGLGDDAIGQLKTTPGAKAGDAPQPREMTGYDEYGQRVEAVDAELVKRRILEIAGRKVTSSSAREAFVRLMWMAWQADPSRSANPEVKTLVELLKAQLEPDVMGKDLPTIGEKDDLPENVLAIWNGNIFVSPTFKRQPLLGKMTTLFHELLHDTDGRHDGSPIEHNSKTGTFIADTEDRDPSNDNAAEKLAYEHMADWAILL